MNARIGKICKSLFLIWFGLDVREHDFQDYASNEPTMDGTASAILMFALESMKKAN